MGRTIVWPKGLLLGAALAAALPRSPCYVHIARACDKEVRGVRSTHTNNADPQTMRPVCGGGWVGRGGSVLCALRSELCARRCPVHARTV